MQRKKVPVVYMDEAIVVCEKPAGMPVQSDRSRDIDVETALKLDIMKKEACDSEPYLTAVHRLDRPVGGLMVFARTKEAAAELSRQIRDQEFEKNYQAILCGEVPVEAGTFEDYLLRNGASNTSMIVDKGTPGAKYAALDFELIDCIEGDQGILSWVMVTLHTGRHHQIRVQFAARDLPLYGDRKYNLKDQKASAKGGKFRKSGKSGGFSPLGLYSTRLAFHHPVTGEKMVFKADPQGEAFELMDVEAF